MDKDMRRPDHRHRALGAWLALACMAGWPGIARAAPPVAAAADCTALPALSGPPLGARDVRQFGAVPDDGVADDAAIQRALQALRPGDWLVFPPGRYLQSHSLLVTVPGVTLWGRGAQLHATDPADQTLGVRADGVRVIGFLLTATTDRRRTTLESARLSVAPPAGGDGTPLHGVVIRDNTIAAAPELGAMHGAASAGILVTGTHRFTLAGNLVRATLADGIHVTGGSRQGRIVGNRVEASGDDLIALVSYLGAEDLQRLRAGHAPAPGTQVEDIVVEDNTGGANTWGRGIAVVGSRGITVRRNRIQGVAHGAGVLVAYEGGWRTHGPSRVLVERNELRDIQVGGAAQPVTGHGAIEVHAIDTEGLEPALASRLGVHDVVLRDNVIQHTGSDGIRIGADSAPGWVHDIRLAGNHVRGQRGRSLAMHLPDALADLHTPGGPIEGARVDCASLP